MRRLGTILRVFLGDWPARWASLAAPVIGTAGASFILVSILAIANGIAEAMHRAGESHVAIVIQAGAALESSSRLSDDEAAAISQATNDTALANSERTAIVSAELLQVVDTISRGGEAGAQVLARGLAAEGVQLRSNFRIVDGRLFTPGRLEVIVGRRLARDFAGLSIGTMLTGAAHEWSIVGVFEDGGSTAESEVWMDLDTARNETGRRASPSSIRVKLRSAASIAALRESLARDPRLQVQVASEREHQSRQFSQAIRRVQWLAITLALVLGVGAVIATIIAMSAAISSRHRAIATLRALGFSGGSTAAALFVEAMLLGLLGGGVGALVAFLVADGYGLAILNAATSTPVALSATVTANSLAEGLALGAALGALAALPPSMVASRVPLRASAQS
jgi:putative ABC transport system permease protein